MKLLELNRDFADFLRELAAAGAEHVVVGGYAVAAHGFFRATKDLDVFVRATPENAARTYAALAKFGAPLHSLQPSDLAAPGIVFQIGVPPRRIDVLTSIDGVDFERASSDVLLVALEDVEMRFIGLDALLANKRASGRAQDKRDVTELTKLHRAAPKKKSKSKAKKKSKAKRKTR